MSSRNHLAFLYISFAAYVGDAIESISLRGRTKQNDASKGPSDGGLKILSGHYFGYNFDDNPFAVNPWKVQKTARMIDNLDPVAPFDRVNRNWVGSITGAAPVEPGKKKADVGYTHPDFVPPYLHPKPFPNELDDGPKDHPIIVPIGDREVVAYEDRLRNPANRLDPLSMYPLVAPADRINPGPWPVTNIDRVPRMFDKFFDQTVQRNAERMRAKAMTDAFKRVDKDDDQAISPQEYDAELVEHQAKTKKQADALWKQYHVSEAPDMTKHEFFKMAKTGYDLGESFVNRSDMSGIITPPQTADKGFWGGGAVCPDGKYIKGVQIKVKPNSDTGDNTALECVKFKCQDDSVIQTAEGPDGAWTGWAECLPGQTVFSVSVRVQPYRLGRDNTGINDLMFKCRSEGHEQKTTLMFGKKVPKEEETGYVFVGGKYIAKNETTVDDKQVVIGNGEVAKEGGWSEELTCGTNGALCGAQGRLQNTPGIKDNMGVTDFRFFCCSMPVDCAVPCKEEGSTDCLACKSKVLSVTSR